MNDRGGTRLSKDDSLTIRSSRRVVYSRYCIISGKGFRGDRTLCAHFLSAFSFESASYKLFRFVGSQFPRKFRILLDHWIVISDLMAWTILSKALLEIPTPFASYYQFAGGQMKLYYIVYIYIYIGINRSIISPVFVRNFQRKIINSVDFFSFYRQINNNGNKRWLNPKFLYRLSCSIGRIGKSNNLEITFLSSISQIAPCDSNPMMIQIRGLTV